MALATLLLLVSQPSPLTLDLPVDCAMGEVCVIHKYVDHDPGPGRKDYACGRLSKDGDTGTDFRTPSYVEMNEGVNVVAAAAGVVRAVRDGMDDISVRETGPEAIQGREAGNAVVLSHDGGWETQYSHLKKGSVSVKPGEYVSAGTILGEIGLSGNTEFPHVEFSVRHHGESVDPFVGEIEDYRCGAPRKPLWTGAAKNALDYNPTGILTAGFAPEGAKPEKARIGAYSEEILPTDVPALVLWADVFGSEAGDRQEFQINGPDNTEIFSNETVLPENNIAWFAFGGRKRPEQGWTPGEYTGTYRLERDGKTIAERTITITLR